MKTGHLNASTCIQIQKPDNMSGKRLQDPRRVLIRRRVVTANRWPQSSGRQIQNNNRRTIAMKESASRVRLLTVAEAAEQLGVKESTIRSWILKREKLEVVKVGRLVRITEVSIQKSIDDNTIPPKEKN